MDSTRRKRDADDVSPLQEVRESKIQKKTVHHTAHPSVCLASELISTPVSRKHVPFTLTGKSLKMGEETSPPDCSELLSLYKALETRVKNLESYLEAKDKELLEVRLENSDLQRQIGCLEAAAIEAGASSAAQSSQSSTGSTTDTSPALSGNSSDTPLGMHRD